MTRPWTKALLIGTLCGFSVAASASATYASQQPRAKKGQEQTLVEWWTDWFTGEDDDAAESQAIAGANAYIKRYDDNNDGVLTRSESPGKLHQDFEAIDQDDNQQLSRNELADYAREKIDAARQARAAERDERKDRQSADANADASKSDEAWWSDWYDDDSTDAQSADAKLAAKNAAEFIQKHDQNQDGQLSKQELPEAKRSGFAQLDQDRNGQLSAAELRQHSARMTQRRLPVEVTYVWVVETNQGRAKLEELQQAYDLLSKIDANGDGTIAPNELKEQQQKVATQWIDRSFERLDANGNDELTPEESRDSLIGRCFKRLDANKDSKLTRAELREAVEQKLERQSPSAESKEPTTTRRESSPVK